MTPGALRPVIHPLQHLLRRDTGAFALGSLDRLGRAREEGIWVRRQATPSRTRAATKSESDSPSSSTTSASLRIGGYERELLTSQATELTAMAHAGIDLDALAAAASA